MRQIPTLNSVKNDLTISLEAARLWGNKGRCACHEMNCPTLKSTKVNVYFE